MTAPWPDRVSPIAAEENERLVRVKVGCAKLTNTNFVLSRSLAQPCVGAGGYCRLALYPSPRIGEPKIWLIMQAATRKQEASRLVKPACFRAIEPSSDIGFDSRPESCAVVFRGDWRRDEVRTHAAAPCRPICPPKWFPVSSDGFASNDNSSTPLPQFSSNTHAISTASRAVLPRCIAARA